MKDEITLTKTEQGHHLLTISPKSPACPAQFEIERLVDGRFRTTVGLDVLTHEIHWNYKWALEQFAFRIVRRMQALKQIPDVHYRLVNFGA